MILSDKEIKRRVEEEKLIENFIEDNLQAASYDITITNKATRFINEFKRINLSDKKTLDSLYEEVDLSLGYDLRPGEYILLQPKEKFNLSADLVAHIRPRTTFTRLGLILSQQHINPDYSGKCSLGLYNASPFVIELIPGLIIGQIVFETLSEKPSKEKLYSNKPDAKYQDEDSFTGSKIYDEVSIKAEEEINRLMGILSRKGKK